MRPGPADDRPHPPGADPDWEESWHFDFIAGDGSLGGFVRLTLRPGEGTAWYWAYLVGPHRPVVVVRDHELEPPRTRALEVRGPGLWAQLICETPLDHWSAGLEAAGVALDDPAEGLRGERGQPIPLGLDLEWEATDPPSGEVSGYRVAAVVHGEILLGADRLDFKGSGWWVHRWGAPPWRDDAWSWAGGRSADGTALSPDSLAGVQLTPVARVLIPLPSRRGLARDLCSWSAGGQQGWGWSERLEPGSG